MQRRVYACCKSLMKVYSQKNRINPQGRPREIFDSERTHKSEAMDDNNILDNWELINGVTLPPFRATCLKLDTRFSRFSLRRMSYVLRQARDLNSLTFDIHASPKQFRVTWDRIASLACTLSNIQKLKTVEIHNFLGSGSSFLELPKPELREFVNEWEKEIKLVKHLLGSCTALEKMNISTIKMPVMPCGMKQEYIHVVERRLLAFPRASVNVELCISFQI